MNKVVASKVLTEEVTISTEDHLNRSLIAFTTGITSTGGALSNRFGEMSS